MSTVRSAKQGFDTVTHDNVNFSTAQSRFSFKRDRRFSSLHPTLTATEFSTNVKTTMN
jgi:hypothetical protein